MLTPSQVPVGAGSATLLGTVPPGCQMALTIPSGTAYIGDGTSVTTTNGSPLAAPYALLPANPATGSPAPVYATAAAGTVPVGVIIATPR